MWDRNRSIKTLKAYGICGEWAKRALLAAKDAAVAFGREFTERGDHEMTERVEVLAGMLGATLLSHPEGHGQPYWRRGELSEAVKEVRKDGGFFASSHGARPPKYAQPDVKFNGACIIQRFKNGKVIEECTGRFIKWNPRTNRTTIITEDDKFKSGEFFCKA